MSGRHQFDNPKISTFQTLSISINKDGKRIIMMRQAWPIKIKSLFKNATDSQLRYENPDFAHCHIPNVMKFWIGKKGKKFNPKRLALAVCLLGYLVDAI